MYVLTFDNDKYSICVNEIINWVAHYDACFETKRYYNFAIWSVIYDYNIIIYTFYTLIAPGIIV